MAIQIKEAFDGSIINSAIVQTLIECFGEGTRVYKEDIVQGVELGGWFVDEIEVEDEKLLKPFVRRTHHARVTFILDENEKYKNQTLSEKGSKALECLSNLRLKFIDEEGEEQTLFIKNEEISYRPEQNGDRIVILPIYVLILKRVVDKNLPIMETLVLEIEKSD